MARVHSGSIIQASAFKKNDASPLDDRVVVENKIDLSTANVWTILGVDTRYEGMLVYVEGVITPSEKGVYVLSNGSAPDTASSWVKLSTGTTTAADNILHGTSSGSEITYAPYSSTTADSTWVGTDGNGGKLYLGDVNPTKTNRLNLNGHLYAKKLYSDGIEVKVIQTAVSDPSADGNSTSFIATISQNTNGVITVTKKNLGTATTTTAGAIKVGAVKGSAVTNASTDDTNTAKRYSVLIDSTGLAYTNVPWTDSDTTYSSGNEITIGTGNAINHDAKLGTAFTSTTAATTISGWGGTGSFKVPVLGINQYGHVTSASEATMSFTIPEAKITAYTAPTYPTNHVSSAYQTIIANNAIAVNTTFDSAFNKLDNKIAGLVQELVDDESVFSQAMEDEPRYYGKSTTSTASTGTVALTATLVENRRYNLFNGTKLDIYFQNNQTVSTCTLNVSGSNGASGAHYLVYENALFDASLIEAGTTLALVYDSATVTISGTNYSGVYRVVGGVGSGGSGTDTKTDQTLISRPTSDANNRPLLIAKGTTSSTGTINDETLFAKNLYYNPKADTLYVGNVETTGNITATGNISGTNITASGKFSGIAEITANQYFSSSKYGIDMQNSDIIHANSIFCNDTSEKGEGLHFFRSNNTYDSLRIDNSGLVKFDKGWGYSSGSASGGTTYDVAISASQTASGITVQTAGTTSDKYYPVQTNPDTGMAVVNVPWSGGGGGGSTVSINVPSPVPTIGTSDTTLATVTIDNVQTLIKAKISAAAGGFDPMEGYSLLSGSYSPLEFLCNFFYPVFLDGKSNDISGVTAVTIVEVVDDPAGIDGHIPVGAIIIMYACYLTEIGCTSGRLILETYAYGDYWGYIVCENDSNCYNVDSGSPSQFGSYDVLNENLVNLLTFNWNSYIGELPMGINDAVQGAAGLVSRNDEIIGGGPDGFYYYHKYIFTFSDIVTGTMYNSLKTNFYQNILAQDFEAAVKEISDNAGTKSGEYFDGMVVTLEHKSCTIADPTDGMHEKTFGWHRPSRPAY